MAMFNSYIKLPEGNYWDSFFREIHGISWGEPRVVLAVVFFLPPAVLCQHMLIRSCTLKSFWG